MVRQELRVLTLARVVAARNSSKCLGAMQLDTPVKSSAVRPDSGGLWWPPVDVAALLGGASKHLASAPVPQNHPTDVQIADFRLQSPADAGGFLALGNPPRLLVDCQTRESPRC